MSFDNLLLVFLTYLNIKKDNLNINVSSMINTNKNDKRFKKNSIFVFIIKF